jgi:type II secretory pathway pseudopilin PulG
MSPRLRAFTLVEVLVATVIAMIMLISTVELLNFNFMYQNQQELRASAMDSLAHEMEKIRRQFIYTVPPYYTVTVSDNRTPDNPNDDTDGVMHVQLFDRAGNALTAEPATDDRVTVVMTVTWHGRGRFSSRLFRESIVGYLIP